MVFPVLSASIAIIIVILRLYYHWWSCKLPPGPRPWPIIGNLHQMKPLWTQCFAEWSQSYGPIISVWFGSNLNIIVSSSDLAKEVLKENDQQLANRPRNTAADIMSANGSDLIWADYGPHYVKLRKICTHQLFSASSIESLRRIRENEAKAMVQSILKDLIQPNTDGTKGLVLRKNLGLVALNNITRLVLGKRFETQQGELTQQGVELKSIVANETKLSASLGLFDHIWWLRWVSSWVNNNGELSKHLARKTQLTQTIIVEHRVDRKIDNGDDAKGQKSFVQTLLAFREKYDLSEETVVGLLWDMITAGMDTIAITVEWTMAQLIKNLNVQRNAQEELDSVIGPHRFMSESDIIRLPYLQSIAKEALRLHPPTPLMLPHKAKTAVRIGGYDIPKGTAVYVNIWALGRDPANWVDPDEFKPERFLVEEVNVKGQDFRILPFGSGRRVCPAAQLGINMMVLMLGHLLHCFSWSRVSEEEIDMKESPGLVAYMQTPLQAVPSLRLSQELYKSL